MNGKQPPEWLIDSVLKVLELSKDTNRWEHRNSYYEAPSYIICPHCGPGKESTVKLHTVGNNGQDPHIVGQCNKCNRVYWTELVER